MKNVPFICRVTGASHAKRGDTLQTLWSGYGPILWRDFAIFSFLVLLLVLTRKERVQP